MSKLKILRVKLNNGRLSLLDNTYSFKIKLVIYHSSNYQFGFVKFIVFLRIFSTFSMISFLLFVRIYPILSHFNNDNSATSSKSLLNPIHAAITLCLLFMTSHNSANDSPIYYSHVRPFRQ